MKRILSLLLVLVMVFSMLPPVPVQAKTNAPAERNNLAFSEDNVFGQLLNASLEETDTSGADLPSYIRALTVSGKTATVYATVPEDALLVVGIYDEEKDTLLGSGTLAVSAGEEEQTLTLSIDIDTMPEFFRGKAFLLNKTNYAPISQSCQFETSTKGYQDIANAKTTDFPEDLVLNLDEDITTNFVVFKEDVVFADISQITKTGTNTFTVTNASSQIKSMGKGDVLFSTQADGSPFLIKVDSLSVNKKTVTIVAASDLKPEDAFQMIKLDIDSGKYGLQEAADPEILPMSSTGGGPQVHLLGTTGDDPLHTNTCTVEKDKFKLELLKDVYILVPIDITTQYYWSVPYAYYSAVIDYTFDITLDLQKADLSPDSLKWSPTVDVQTPIPGVSVEGIAEIKLKIEAGHAYHLKIQGSFGQEFFAGNGKFHDISTSPKIVNEYQVKGIVELSFAMGVGLSFLDMDDILDVFEGTAVAELSIKGKTFLRVDAVLISVTDDLGDKIHVCQGCSKLEITMGLSVMCERTLLLVLKWETEIPLDKKTIAKGHFCWLHDDPLTYPYEYGIQTEFHRGWTECDRIAYRVELETQDADGNPIPNTPITLARADAKHVKIYQTVGKSFTYMPYEDLVTDSSGHVTCYLENGTYYASVGGENIPFIVNSAPGTFTLIGEETLPDVGEQELLIKTDPDLFVGDTAAVSAVLHAATVDVDVTGDVQWSVEDSSIVSLTEGDAPYLTALKRGSTKLIATVTYFGEVFQAECSINVTELIDSGTLKTLSWTLDSDYVLTISGTNTVMLTPPWRSYNPKIKKIIINEGITSIGSGDFEECVSLESVILPDSLKTIASGAFLNCVSLNYIYLPKNVSFFANGAFTGCTSLVRVDIDPENTKYSMVGDLILTDKGNTLYFVPLGRTDTVLHVPETVLVIEQAVCRYYPITKLELPSCVLSIKDYAFQYCDKLESVEIYDVETPASSLFIYNNSYGSHSFAYCSSLKEIAFLPNIPTISPCTFSNCTSLKHVEVPEHITSIGFDAFINCSSLQFAKLPKGLSAIHLGLFYGCTSLSEVILPENIQNIPQGCFQYCSSLEEIVLPDSVTSISQLAFYDCTNLKRITLPQNLETIGEQVFGNCISLTGIALPEKLQRIASFVFLGSGLTDIVIPDSVTSIGVGALAAQPLTSATLGTGITSLPTSLFAVEDSSLQSVTIRGTLTSIATGAFGSCFRLTDVYYGGPDWNAVQISQLEYTQGSLYTATIHYIDVTTGEAYVSEAPEATEQVIPEETTEVVPAESLADRDDAWYQLSLLSSSSDTDIKEEADGSITVHYAGLIPGSQYLLLMRKDSDKAPDPDNLLYIDQLTAAEDGSLTYRFNPRVTGTGAKPMLIQALYPRYPILGLENPDSYDLFHVDGKPLESLSAGLTRKDSLVLTGYRHSVSTTRTDTPAAFTQYPVSMDVWMLTFQEDSNCYQAEKLTQMHDLLLYDGCSIRITGVKGIRMITSLSQSTKNQLTAGGIQGYTLEEYGTLVCWQTDLESGDGSLTLADSYAMSNFAYSRAKDKDAVFAKTEDGRVRYTNVLVNFSMDQCRQALCMRPYMILKNAAGQQITVYGGIVTRSIGYIALQNADTFPEGSESYNYVHDIIKHCYPTV